LSIASLLLSLFFSAGSLDISIASAFAGSSATRFDLRVEVVLVAMSVGVKVDKMSYVEAIQIVLHCRPDQMIGSAFGPQAKQMDCEY
jgi:hypothetical protein